MPNSVDEIKAGPVAVRAALAEQVRAERARRQLTQEQLAELAGMSPARISEIENGGTDPRFSTIVRVADALGLAVSIAPAA